ncbi:MAG: hypothetical protein Tsb0013_22500 [Phycisphaerales bacterium]
MPDHRIVPSAALALLAPAVLVSEAHAVEPQITTSYGIEFVTVGDPGNAPYPGGGLMGSTDTIGRGSVGYEYRIAQYEVRTSEWMEFLNALSVASNTTSLHVGLTWGATRDVTSADTYRLREVAGSGDLPVLGISWRQAAVYANWLHNDKDTALDAFLSGAYDVSTFGTDESGFFTDQPTRSEGARFWIPSLDEQLKAYYYDPSRHGENQPGWWQFANSSDSPPIVGLPSEGGQTNAGLYQLAINGGGDQYNFENNHVGSYPEHVSPWGLLDTSGGATEWNEEIIREGPSGQGPYARGLKGSSLLFPTVGDQFTLAQADAIEWLGFWNPPGNGLGFGTGLRIAANVPSPGATALCALVLVHNTRRTRHETPTQRTGPRIRNVKPGARVLRSRTRNGSRAPAPVTITA